jgi:hypothetical protein
MFLTFSETRSWLQRNGYSAKIIIVGRPCALLRGPALSRRKRFVRGANAIFFDLLRVLYTKNQSIVATSDQNL